MPIVHQSAPFLPTPPPVPVLLLPAPPKRLALAAPKIAGYLPAPCTLPFAIKPEVFGRKGSGDEGKSITPKKRVVVAEIVNPLLLIDIRRNPDAWWEEFERIHGKIKTIEEMDAEIEAKHPGYMAWVARQKQAEAARS